MKNLVEKVLNGSIKDINVSDFNGKTELFELLISGNAKTVESAAFNRFTIKDKNEKLFAFEGDGTAIKHAQGVDRFFSYSDGRYEVKSNDEWKYFHPDGYPLSVDAI